MKETFPVGETTHINKAILQKVNLDTSMFRILLVVGSNKTVRLTCWGDQMIVWNTLIPYEGQYSQISVDIPMLVLYSSMVKSMFWYGRK